MRALKSRRRGWASDAPEQEYWLSYSDLMAGLLMVFALMLLSALYFYGKRFSELSSVIAVQEELIEVLSEIIGEVDSGITIDPATGSVRFEGQVLFDEGSAELRPDGIETLAVFTTKVLPRLLRERRYTDHLESIVIEGHTNDNGSYLYNLALSQSRAYEVMRYILESTSDRGASGEAEHTIPLDRFLTANGRSYSTPVCLEPDTARFYAACKRIDMERSRRIEIRFRLKTEEALRRVRDIVEGQG